MDKKCLLKYDILSQCFMGHYDKTKQAPRKKVGYQMTEEAKSNIYDLPRVYHASFPSLWPSEIALIKHVFSAHSPFPVATILEPCCGTGRALVDLAQLGYKITGYDRSAAMVAYANDRIRKAGLETLTRAILGDMTTIEVAGTFDSAINLINSIGYLTSDDDVIHHFCNTAASLRTGGIYLVHLGFTRKDSSPNSVTWSSETDGVQVTTTWGLHEIDRPSKIRTEFCLIKVADGDNHFVIDERHTMRVWLLEDLRNLAIAGGLRLEAVYDERGNRLENDECISEFKGNLYFVLRSI
jgi:SAM-dependent methyltransferase